VRRKREGRGRGGGWRERGREEGREDEFAERVKVRRVRAPDELRWRVVKCVQNTSPSIG